MSVKRVAFVFEGVDASWLGGLNYYRNLFHAVHDLPDATIKIVVFGGKKTDFHGLDEFTQVVRSSLFDRASLSNPLKVMRMVLQKVFGKDLLLYYLLLKSKIDCLSHYGYFGFLWRGCKIPSLTWIPDFQHLRLPDFFSQAEIDFRDDRLSNLFKFGHSVVLSSHSAEKDLRHFFPNVELDVYVLQFTSVVAQDWVPSPKESLQARYQLGQDWFHIPNQFWMHKNHRIVIHALQNLKLSGVNPTIVSTGSAGDHRNPAHYESLTNLISEFGLDKSFRLLGLVSYDDMLSLMYHSIAVINPSLFEGWSTTVEEGKSLGKKILLSDIDVHVEQAPCRASYFNPHDASALANLIKKSLEDFDPEEEKVCREEARNGSAVRQQSVASNYQKIIMKLISSSNERVQG